MKKFISAAFRLFKKPDDIEALLNLGDVIAETPWFLTAVKKFEQQDKYSLMAERKDTPLPELAVLEKYPEGSLGKGFHQFITSNNLSTYDVKINSPSKAIWLRERSRKLHDLLHVVLNKGTSVKDEVCLNAYLVYSIGAPISCLIMWGGLVRLAFTDFSHFLLAIQEIRKIKMWAKTNPCLLSIPFEDMLEMKFKLSEI